MRILNKNLLLSVFLFSILIAEAQNNIEVYTGTSFMYFKNKSLNTGLSSYENYWKNNGEPNISFKRTSFNKEFCYGINFLIDHDSHEQYIIGLQHFNSRNEQVASLSTGKRHFKSIQLGDILYFGIRNMDQICYKFGLGYTKCILQNSFEYPNGIRSYGMEKLSNGVYSSLVNLTMNLELTKQKVFYSHLGVEGGIAIYKTFAGEYRDKNVGKFENVGGDSYRIIPQDYQAAQDAYNAGPGYGYSGKTVNGSSFSIGLILKATYLIFEQD